MKISLWLIISMLIISTTALSQNKQLNVTNLGAKGNDTQDDTAYFQKGIDLLSKSNGGTLFIPSGIYYISTLRFMGKRYSNIRIIGHNATIKQLIPKQRKVIGAFKTYALRNAADGCFLFDAEVSNQKDDSNSIRNIYISGLTFKSDVAENGFDELLHQISAHGVSNFTVDNCSFTGFYGDAIAINGSTDFSKHRNAYNKKIIIKNSNFDGVNRDNRQAISIYYADGFLITDCSFKNTTRHNMPGAIDLESDDSRSVSRNGKIINCTFENIGGIAAIVFHIKPSTQENNYSYRNFVVDQCKFTDTNSAVTVFGNDTFRKYTLEENIVTLKNLQVTDSYILFDFRKAYGIDVRNVYANNITNKYNNIVSEGGASRISFTDCTFDNFANPNGLGFTGELFSINFENNVFKNFTNNAITVNSVHGLGIFKNNQFLSTRTKGGFPLITQYFVSKNDIKNAVFINNKSKQNFIQLDISYFYKPN